MYKIERLKEMFENEDYESISVIDHTKYPEDIAKIIYTIQVTKKFSAREIFKRFGIDVSIKYIEMCNQVARKKVDQKQQEYLVKSKNME